VSNAFIVVLFMQDLQEEEMDLPYLKAFRDRTDCR
jgi:hypothetical protein